MTGVYGKTIPAAKRTWRALAVPLWRYDVPLLLALTLLDAIVFLALNKLSGACYGAFAWFGVC